MPSNFQVINRPLQRALPRLQHRQSQPGAAARFHRLHRRSAGPQGADEFAAAAGRRRAGHLSRCQQLNRLDRLHASHRHPHWHRALCRVVPGLLQILGKHPLRKRRLP